MKAKTKDLERLVFATAIMFAVNWAYSIFLVNDLPISNALKEATGFIALYVVGLGVFSLISKDISDESYKKNQISFKVISLCFLLQFTALMVFLVIGLIMERIGIGAPDEKLTISPYILFTLLIFNPLAEEFVFRHLFAKKLLKHGERFYILASSYCFAIAHGVSIGLPAIFYTFILALIWSFLLAKTGSLSLVIIMHAFSNLFSGLMITSLISISETAIGLYLILVMFLACIGLILFIKNRQKIILDGSSGLVDKATVRDVFSNKGILFYTVLSLIVMLVK